MNQLSNKEGRFIVLLALIPVLIISCQPKKLQTLEPGVWISLEGGYDGDFSPDGQNIVFTNSEPGRTWKEDIWVYSMQTGKRNRLHYNVFWDGEARWSPDGKKIIFTTDMLKLKNLTLLNYPEGPIEEITKAGAYHPCWAPDGKHIVFVSDRSGSTELWLMNLETYIFHQLTYLAADIASPAWAPDNSGIVFCLKKEDQWDLWMLPLPLGDPRPLFQTIQNECYPRWSKSGKLLSFCSFMPGGKDGLRASKLWIAARDGSGSELFLTDVVQVKAAQQPQEKLFYPCFSPDENLLLFSSNPSGYRWDIGFIDLSKKLK